MILSICWATVSPNATFASTILDEPTTKLCFCLYWGDRFGRVEPKRKAVAFVPDIERNFIGVFKVLTEFVFEEKWE